MPEMTPERIEALAQSAKDRDPNPDPLDAREDARPEREVDVYWAQVDGVSQRTHLTGSGLSWEVSPEGDLIIASDDGDAAIYARGSWQHMLSRTSTAEVAR